MNLDFELSNDVKSRIKSRPKACWKNAFKALKIYGPAGAIYVEGWAILKDDEGGQPGLTIEHGWIEYGDKIVDPTLPGRMSEYYPGIRYTLEEALEAASRIKELPFAWHLTADPRYSGYRRAFDKCMNRTASD